MTNPIVDKAILLGVTGSISAYKAAELASKLHQAGAKVDVILTPSAERFITPLTFQSVTGRKAYTDAELWGNEGHVVHIGLGHAADLLVIAPASANTLARLAYGMGDNLLSVTALAAACPLVIAPAMDAGMWSHPATQANVELLRQRGAYFIGPAEGHLASGLVGLGRLVEPADIVNHIRWIMGKGGPLAGKKIVVTAGSTHEPIDPVREITNRSSGRQGFALAQSALDAGAEVALITGPHHLVVPVGVRLINVDTASEMLEAVMTETESAEALIMAAAVADFRPVQASVQKIKKEHGLSEIPLEATTDILATVSKRKQETGSPKRLIGFAAESQQLLENARSKLRAKRLDLIIANDVTAPDAGFEVETNRVTLIYSDGHTENLPVMAKSEVADIIIHQVIQWI
jgi:phosphopantothenoylcysteine decarboxylase/phosphopantothenate--cysteine ligase